MNGINISQRMVLTFLNEWTSHFSKGMYRIIQCLLDKVEKKIKNYDETNKEKHKRLID